jgi:ZIP family zinc transporter
VAGALALAIGIGLQNFPEGTAVSVPLHRDGMPKGRAFFLRPAFGGGRAGGGPARGGGGRGRPADPPYALAFAAGAMIFVVAEELIPESQQGGNADLATMALIGGFALMMTLDVALG